LLHLHALTPPFTAKHLLPFACALARYYLLFLVYCTEAAYIFWSFCCCLGLLCGRGKDNSDQGKDYNANSSSSSAAKPDGVHCCQGTCDTREDPPKGRGCNQTWVETFFYRCE
jgi:hypothetical protein